MKVEGSIPGTRCHSENDNDKFARVELDALFEYAIKMYYEGLIHNSNIRIPQRKLKKIRDLYKTTLEKVGFIIRVKAANEVFGLYVDIDDDLQRILEDLDTTN